MLYTSLLLLAWPRSLLLLVPLLILGWPLLLAGWALFRLRAASSAGGVGRACLLAGYSAAVQLTNRTGEQVLPLVHFIILAQLVQACLALDILFIGRSGSPGLTVLGVFVATWLAYRYGRPALDRRFRTWNTGATLETYSPAQRRAWGLLGHACFWGAFCFIFVCIGLRGKLEAYL
ncbi:MAG TPA: hypothetical protein VK364_07960 [Hymenobacter sp.]|nr:hypothetical protein [Hymenobacter sp.]